jgi:aspartyl/asparaginyl-tRNA synthetase
VDYGEAIQALERANEKLEFLVKWCIDLQSEHERYLTEKYAKKPVIVMNYPKAIKAFYMRVNDDGHTVAAMDVLAPEIAFAGLSDNAALAEALLKHTFAALLNERQEDLGFFDQRIEKGLVANIEGIVAAGFDAMPALA